MFNKASTWFPAQCLLRKAMRSSTEDYVGKFRDASIAFFGPLAEKHGLKLVASNLTEYSIPMKELTVRVRLIPSHVPDAVVSVFSNDPKWLENSPLRSWGVNILNFVQIQDPQFDFADSRLSNSAEISVKMALLAELVSKYCEPLFHGDLSLWHRVANATEEKVRAGKS